MNNKQSVPVKGCKGVCLKWHTIAYAGRHNVVNGFASGKVGCSVCEVMYDKSHLKNKKICSCCGKQVRFKAVRQSYKKPLEINIKDN